MRTLWSLILVFVTPICYANYDPKPIMNCIEASVGLTMISAMGHNPDMEKVRDYDSKADDLIDMLAAVIAERGRSETPKEIKSMAQGHAISVRRKKGIERAKKNWEINFHSVKFNNLGGQTCEQFSES
ncbi:hypothetical protein [Vibrio breoganii]|uniref:hypothetical protein n=1 Tax=Vibrio breoganii TaxID=553239 RepID=UPI0021C2EA6F|nr:hypothetical protein [Vibrio breoganii]MDN3717763.1 hypothetical protein [Vibrio breoganii]